MNEYSEEFKFEEAQLVKEKIDQGKQARLDALSINGQQRGVNGEIKLIISDKKL